MPHYRVYVSDDGEVVLPEPGVAPVEALRRVTAPPQEIGTDPGLALEVTERVYRGVTIASPTPLSPEALKDLAETLHERGEIVF